jgi:hypothetical protein
VALAQPRAGGVSGVAADAVKEERSSFLKKRSKKLLLAVADV